MKHASGNPMKANFKSAFKQMDPMTPQPQDIKNPASPMMKPLVGKQKNLPDHLKKEILAAPVKKRHDKIKQDEKDKKTIEGDKIVRRMKQLEKKLKLDPNDKAAKDELLKLSTTTRGQEYTDTGK